MCAAFPTEVSCNIPYIGAAGGKAISNGLCVLTQNNINEKLYLVFWFWFVFMFAVSVFAITYRLVTILSENVRFYLIYSKVSVFKSYPETYLFGNDCPDKTPVRRGLENSFAIHLGPVSTGWLVCALPAQVWTSHFIRDISNYISAKIVARTSSVSSSVNFPGIWSRNPNNPCLIIPEDKGLVFFRLTVFSPHSARRIKTPIPSSPKFNVKTTWLLANKILWCLTGYKREYLKLFKLYFPIWRQAWDSCFGMTPLWALGTRGASQRPHQTT